MLDTAVTIANRTHFTLSVRNHFTFSGFSVSLRRDKSGRKPRDDIYKGVMRAGDANCPCAESSLCWGASAAVFSLQSELYSIQIEVRDGDLCGFCGHRLRCCLSSIAQADALLVDAAPILISMLNWLEILYIRLNYIPPSSSTGRLIRQSL